MKHGCLASWYREDLEILRADIRPGLRGRQDSKERPGEKVVQASNLHPRQDPGPESLFIEPLTLFHKQPQRKVSGKNEKRFFCLFLF